MGRPRVLFVAQHPSSFVRDDLDLLGERYEVVPLWSGGSPAGALAEQARRLRAARADLVFGWFADYHLVLPTLWAERRDVPSVVVLGGYDAVRLPSLGYGVFASRWRAPLARLVCRRATRLAPVAEALVAAQNPFATWPTPSAQGVRAHVPGLRTPATVVPTGYDPAAWPPGPAERAPSVLTVALVGDERTWRLKGLDLLAAAAARLPDVPFRVVGVAPAVAAREAGHVPPNLTLDPPVERGALAAAYAAASVYAQPSRSEGLPNALCEAMLVGCVPVVSPVGAMPEAAAGVGRTVPRPEGGALAEAVADALGAADGAARQRARDRVAGRYSRERRRRALFRLLDGLMDGEAPAALAADVGRADG